MEQVHADATTAGARAERSAARALPAPLASLAERLRGAGPGAAAFGLPFALVAYLGLKGGGYDSIVRGEVGIALWWIVLLGAAVGVLPVARIGRLGWAAIALLAGFAVWTGLGISWSESAERSVAELARLAMHGSVLVLALLTVRRRALPLLAGGVATGIVAVAAVALLSRLQPELISGNPGVAELMLGTQARLSYPLDYWNGLAALAAIGIPLLLHFALAARSIALRALSAAAVPALALTAFYTLSRGGAFEVGFAMAVLFVLHPRRLALVPMLLATGGASALAIAAATQRNALEDGLRGPLSAAQGDEMLAFVLVVGAGAGLVASAMGLASRHGLTRTPRVSRRTATLSAATSLAAALVVAIGAGGPGWIGDRWVEFKSPTEQAAGAERFASVSSAARYEQWASSVDAFATAPVTGIGPGTWEYWWARDDRRGSFVRDAHSLYLESLAETGVIGFILIGGFVALVLVGGGYRALREPSAARRSLLAAITASCVAFAIAAGIDWAWELTVLPVAFLVLAAGLLRGRGKQQAARSNPGWGRALLVALAVAGLVAIAIPLAGTSKLRASQSEAGAAALNPALEQARGAAEIEPWAASPELQQALVLELAGDLGAAAIAARAATDAEPTNWRTWLVLSRLEAESGDPRASLKAYREARSLNPRSPLFAR